MKSAYPTFRIGLSQLAIMFLSLCCFLMMSCDPEDPIDPVINECEGVVCQNEGECVEGVCECPEGFSGANCEIEDLCFTQNIICENGGECIEGVCDCPDGFSGENCEIEDMCITQNIVCENGGICVDGICDCPDGFLGTNCETVDMTQIQTILDAGTHTPLDLYNLGVTLEQLYGQNYNGGIIFYVDVMDDIPELDGMVVTETNLGSEILWGCELLDIEDLPNLSGSDIDSESARIGDGDANTDIILANCTEEGIAAQLCREISEDWYLPSKATVDLLYTNLHLNGYGNFSEGFYWSSTEADYSNPGVVAWGQNFDTGLVRIDGKGLGNYVRAVSKF